MKAEEEAKLNAENQAKTPTTTFKTTIMIEEITTVPPTTTTQNYPIIIEEVTTKPSTTTTSSSTTSVRTTGTTITTDLEPPSSREVTGLSKEEIERFNLAFNSCVDKYSKCKEYRGDETYCKDQFNECSLGILSDAKLNDGNEVQPFTYDANYENDLFICIQTYTTCTSTSGNSCMENYNVAPSMFWTHTIQ